MPMVKNSTLLLKIDNREELQSLGVYCVTSTSFDNLLEAIYKLPKVFYEPKKESIDAILSYAKRYTD